MAKEGPEAETKPAEGRYWLDESRNVTKIFYGLVAFCAAIAAADLFYEKNVHFAAERVIGSYGIYGFVCCVGLVLAAKELRKLVKRDEGYYDRDG